MISDYIVFWMRNNRRRKLKRYEKLYATSDGTIHEHRTVSLQEFMQVMHDSDFSAKIAEIVNMPCPVLSRFHNQQSLPPD